MHGDRRLSATWTVLNTSSVDVRGVAMTSVASSAIVSTSRCG